MAETPFGGKNGSGKDQTGSNSRHAAQRFLMPILPNVGRLVRYRWSLVCRTGSRENKRVCENIFK